MALLLLVGLSAVVHADQFLKKGLPFFRARELVLKQGWKPIRMHTEIVKEGEDGFPSSGIERSLINRGVEELSSCSLGKTFCVFYYARQDKCFLLETEGEEIKQMRLVYWKTVECPVPD